MSIAAGLGGSTEHPMLTSSLFALAAALGGSGPTPLNDPAYWVNIPSNLPPYLQSDRERIDGGSVSIELVVDAKGVPVSCLITQPSDDRRQDLTICNELQRNGRFDPARDEAGVVLAGIWVTKISWDQVLGGDGHGLPLGPEITIKVDRAVGTSGRAMVAIRQVILPNGKTESCTTHRSSGYPDLDDLACTLAKEQLETTPLVDSEGNNIRGLRIRLVGFKSTRR
jgi:hypothetical protein